MRTLLLLAALLVLTACDAPTAPEPTRTICVDYWTPEAGLVPGDCSEVS